MEDDDDDNASTTVVIPEVRKRGKTTDVDDSSGVNRGKTTDEDDSTVVKLYEQVKL